MQGRPVIGVLLASDWPTRNYVGSGAIPSLAAGYDVRYIVVEGRVSEPLLERYGLAGAERIEPVSPRRITWMQRFLALTMFKFAARAEAFRQKTAMYPPRSRAVYRLFALPGLFSLASWFVARVMPEWGGLADWIARERPSAMLMPSVAADPWTLLMIATAARRRVPTFVLVNSWDNLVSKGVLPLKPDLVGVWGPQGLRQAAEVQDIPADRVVVLGAPQFEAYVDGTPRDPDAVRRASGIPPARPVVLFAGRELPFDEMDALVELDAAIGEGRLPPIEVLYRPHPSMANREGERHFDTYGFRHVHLDATMRTFYDARFAADGTLIGKRAPEMPDMAYYPSLLAALTGIITPLGTLALEGAANGVPSTLVAYADGRHDYIPPSRQLAWDHVRDIVSFPGTVVCGSRAELVSCVARMLEAARDSSLAPRLREAARSVVLLDGRPYAERLASAVGSRLERWGTR